MENLETVFLVRTHTDVSVCAIREVFLCWSKNWPAAGKEGGGTGWRERMKGRMEGSEMDTGGRAGTHPFLALSLPPSSPFPPFKPPLSPSLCLGNKRCPDTKHSALCLWDSAGRITVGRRKTLRSRQIPLLSSLTSCHFFSLRTYITRNVMVNDRIFW